MSGPVSAYVTAIFALLFSGASALTLIYVVKHFDQPDVRSSQEPEVRSSQEHVYEQVAV